MQRPIPKTTLLRFPLVFGAILMASGIAFSYRRELMGDMEAQRKELFKTNPEDTRKLQEFKLEHQRRMNNK